MLNNVPSILLLIAQDFIQLTPYQQISVGIKLKLCGVEASATVPIEDAGVQIFKAAYEKGKIPALVKEIRQMLYE